MSINSIFQFLVPKDKKFFPLFEEASSNLIELASNLHEAVNLPLKEREVLFQSDVEVLIGKRPFEEKKVLDVPIAESVVEEIKPVEKPAEKKSTEEGTAGAGSGIFPLPA